MEEADGGGIRQGERKHQERVEHDRCCHRSGVTARMVFALITMTSFTEKSISLVLGGDVMTGRGIDQILPHAGGRVLYESYVHDAWEYVRLAMQASGRFQTPVDYDYVWGDARRALAAADVRIVNLETSITIADAPWSGKGIHYRMHPDNIGCLAAAGLNCCGLANNHVLDWGYAGLEETRQTLQYARIGFVGAGRNAAEAAAPAILTVPDKGRVLVVAVGSSCSGIPSEWAATKRKAGIHVLGSLTPDTARRLAQALLRVSRPDDVTVISIHWGGNWGYDITAEEAEFAHALVDEGIDVVHGHSPHHAKAIEFWRGGVIFYGCGDFLNDYEGIAGHEAFRPDLSVLYRVNVTLGLRRQVAVELVPFQLRRLRLNHASAADAQWLCARLQDQSAALGTVIQLQDDNRMNVSARPP